MVKFHIQKYLPVFQLIASSILLFATIIVLFSASSFASKNALFNFLLLALFIQSLIVPYLLFKIIGLEKDICTYTEKHKVFAFCNSLFTIHNDFLRDSANLFSELEKAITEQPTESDFQSTSNLFKRIQSTKCKLNAQTKLFSQITDLQNRILKPNSEWCNINEVILSSSKKILKPTTKNTIVFQVNPKLNLVNLDKKSLIFILQTIIDVAFIDANSGVTIYIHFTYKKPFLKISLEINTPLFSKEKFSLSVAKHCDRNLPQTNSFERDFSLLEGYLMVNKGLMVFDDSKNENSSVLNLLLNVKHLSKIKDKD